MAAPRSSDDQLFFVGIRDNSTVRKELLQSSKGLLDTLKRHELYRKVKEDKLRGMNDLKRVFDELLVLNKKLRGKMPKVPIKVPEVQLREEVVQRAQVQKNMPKGRQMERMQEKPSSAKSKLDLLEDELAKVEARLGNIE